MTILLYVVQIAFSLMALTLIVGFAQSKHIGFLLGAIVFGGAAVASYYLLAWWPRSRGTRFLSCMISTRTPMATNSFMYAPPTWPRT